MLIEINVFCSETKVIDTDKIISISDINEYWIGQTGNMRLGCHLYRIQFLDNSVLDVRGDKEDLQIQRNKLIEFWNKHKIDIPKI